MGSVVLLLGLQHHPVYLRHLALFVSDTLWFSLLLLFILVDLNLGFGLQDNWGEGSGCPYPELDLNAIIPSEQMDTQAPPVESLNISITGSSFSDQRMTQGSAPEQRESFAPGDNLPLYGLLNGV